jgi:hypothetical protein
MTDERSLRSALAALATADAPGPVDTGAVRGQARRLRHRRRANAAVAAGLCGVALLAGVARPHGRTNGLEVANDPSPTSSPRPSPDSTEPATPDATSTPAPGGPSSPRPGSPTPGSPTPGSPTPGGSTEPTPSAAPGTSAGQVPPPGTAEPKQVQVCNLLVDGANDEGSAPAAPSLDVRSADVATGADDVVAVVRVRDLGGSDPAQGATWSFGWTLGTTRYAFDVTKDATGRQGAPRLVVTPAGGTSSTVDAVTVVLDATANTIRWTTARANVPDLATESTFTALRADTWRGTGATATAATAADTATSNATYDDRTPSCVKTG